MQHHTDCPERSPHSIHEYYMLRMHPLLALSASEHGLQHLETATVALTDRLCRAR